MRHKCSGLMLSELTAKTFADYRDERLKEVTASTVSREFTIYKHAFQVAINEWDIPLKSNPLHKVKLPKYDDKRSRRLEPGELEIITDYCKAPQQHELLNVIILAIETGMRRGEILRLSEDHFNCAARTLYIPLTKTGHPRTIPLTSKAVAIVSNLEPNQLVYSKSMEGFQSAWQRLIKRTGIVDLRFHDLRHEAISRFFEMGLSVPEVALISGHRDYRMLQRYTHLKPEQVALKLQ
jgi:integrase